ncbi:MAG: electron transfer flavoprotein subunit beta/FixA family protein [Anaerolineae bacterium]|nr:electron transfer flavoprotein subunit beta/FixA family protein [Anaerolineae bacterium]
MRIIVAIKQVPETSKVKMDPETGTMQRAGLEAIINPLDLYAIETALRLKQAAGGLVTVLTMGPPKAESALREAVAMGCDDAVLLSDRRFGGADTWATAYTLAQAVRRMGDFDLIVCGERATDGDTGQVGPSLAAFLDLPLATYASKAEWMADGRLRVERLEEDGRQVLALPVPALITVVKEIASPRLPTLRGMKTAKALQIPVWGPEEIEADPGRIGLKGSPTRVVKIESPKLTRAAEMLPVGTQQELDDALARTCQFLRQIGIEPKNGGAA